MIRVTFRVGVLKLRGEDAPRLERAVERLRMDVRDGLARSRDFDAAAKRFRDLLIRTTVGALTDG